MVGSFSLSLRGESVPCLSSSFLRLPAIPSTFCVVETSLESLPLSSQVSPHLHPDSIPLYPNCSLLIKGTRHWNKATLIQCDFILNQLHLQRLTSKQGHVHRFWMGLNFRGTLVNPVESPNSLAHLTWLINFARQILLLLPIFRQKNWDLERLKRLAQSPPALNGHLQTWSLKLHFCYHRPRVSQPAVQGHTLGILLSANDNLKFLFFYSDNTVLKSMSTWYGTLPCNHMSCPAL